MSNVFKAGFWSAALTLARLSSGFVVAKLVALYGGPMGVAYFSQIQTLISSVNGVIAAPVSTALVKYTAQSSTDYYRASIYWRASVWWQLFFIIFLSFFGLIFSKDISRFLTHSDEYHVAIKILVFSLPGYAIWATLQSVLNGFQDHRRFIVFSIIGIVLGTLLTICFAFFYGIYGATVGQILLIPCIGLSLFVCVKKLPWCTPSLWFGSVTKEVFKSITSFVLIALVSACVGPLSQIIIRNFLGDLVSWHDVGLWQAVYRISEAYLAVIVAFISIYHLPRLSALSAKADIYNEIINNSRKVLPCVVLLALIIFISRHLILSILYTEKFSQAESLFSFQLIGDFFKIGSWLWSYNLLARGATRFFVCVELFSSIISIILNYIMILFFGLYGVVYAHIVLYVGYWIFMVVSFRRGWY